MGSAVETEVGGLYMNALELSPRMRTTLEELDYPQLGTTLRTDNSTADGITNKQSNKDKARQWTRDSIGYKIELNKENSDYSGRQENTII